jgi:hypothetical protein
VNWRWLEHTIYCPLPCPVFLLKLMDVWSWRFDWIVAEQLKSRFLVSFSSVHFDISWGTPIWTPLVDCRNSEASMSSWDWKPRWRMNPQCSANAWFQLYTDVCLHTWVWLYIPRYHLCMSQLVIGFVWKWGTSGPVVQSPLFDQQRSHWGFIPQLLLL